MHRSRPSRKLAPGWTLLVALLALGCGSDGPSAAPLASAGITLTQITTLTTVQASSGQFLSPSAHQNVPDYVLRGGAPESPGPAVGSKRAKVDVALLFRSESEEPPALEAVLEPGAEGERAPLEHYFPDVAAETPSVRWPLQPFRRDAAESLEVSSEWGGWRAFGGLHVRQPDASDAGAPAATLDYEMRGAPSPLVLSLNESDELVVTNQSGQGVERALLVYSHPGGVAVTTLGALGPGASRITTLGPKEQPPEVLLERARAVLADFFASSVEPALAEAMAAAKSTPFLETQGFRLISILGAAQSPARLRVAGATVATQEVVVSHSEILKVEEEARVMSVVSNASLGDSAVTEQLGRFAEGKLELAATSSEAAVSERALALLARVRGP